MPGRRRRRLRLHSPGCCHWGGGPWHHAMYGPPPWWSRMPSPEEEKEAVHEYIEALKEEIEAAEGHLKELEEPD